MSDKKQDAGRSLLRALTDGNSQKSKRNVTGSARGLLVLANTDCCKGSERTKRFKEYNVAILERKVVRDFLTEGKDAYIGKCLVSWTRIWTAKALCLSVRG